jgi:hypothetical protein
MQETLLLMLLSSSAWTAFASICSGRKPLIRQRGQCVQRVHSVLCPPTLRGVDDAESSLRANNFGKLIDQHPAIGQWAAGDPRGAVAASDDTKSLGILGSAWDMFKRSKNPVLAFAAGVDAFDRQDFYANSREGVANTGLRAGEAP